MSRYFCRRVGIRGRWDAPKFDHISAPIFTGVSEGSIQQTRPTPSFWRLNFEKNAPRTCQRRKNNININFLGRIPRGRTPGKEPFFPDPKSLCQALFYCKTQGIPNIHFCEHKLLVAPRLAFQEGYAKQVYVVFSVPNLKKKLRSWAEILASNPFRESLRELLRA